MPTMYAGSSVWVGQPTSTHTHTRAYTSTEPGRPIPYLENVLLDFPDLQVVMGHVGVPWFEEVMTLLWKFPNT